MYDYSKCIAIKPSRDLQLFLRYFDEVGKYQSIQLCKFFLFFWEKTIYLISTVYFWSIYICLKCVFQATTIHKCLKFVKNILTLAYSIEICLRMNWFLFINFKYE
jgi:hypothetical protein